MHGPTPIDDADPLCLLGSSELRARYAAGSLSPVEVATACLDRAAAVQVRFNAFVRIDRDGALAAAAASEARWRRGEPLSEVDGVPATIKDIVWVKGWPARYGSPTTPEASCERDAPAVAALRRAGVTFLGSTTTPEFGWKAVTDGPLSGITRNPWNPALTPGGSSGGAAVAAATGAGIFHLGTDGGGSIRIPASFTGIAGLKPTYGRVPAYPASPFGTVAHLGPMARRGADCRAMLAAMSGRDPDDWLQGPGQLPRLDGGPERFAGARLGYWTRPPRGAVDPEVAAIVDAAVRGLERLGATVEPIDLPGDDLFETFQVHWLAGAAARIALVPPELRARLDPGLQRAAAVGATYGAVDYIRAAGARARFGRDMDALLTGFDLVVSPAAACAAFPAGHEVAPGSGFESWIEWAGFSYPVNLSQQPACALPCGRTTDGLPVGLQLIGARGADARVIAFAQAFETAFPEHCL